MHGISNSYSKQLLESVVVRIYDPLVKLIRSSVLHPLLQLHNNGELENIGWIEIKKAKLFPIADVTEFLINRLIELDNDKIIFKKNRLYPMFTRRNNKRWVKWDQ